VFAAFGNALAFFLLIFIVFFEILHNFADRLTKKKNGCGAQRDCRFSAISYLPTSSAPI